MSGFQSGSVFGGNERICPVNPPVLFLISLEAGTFEGRGPSGQAFSQTVTAEDIKGLFER